MVDKTPARAKDPGDYQVWIHLAELRGRSMGGVTPNSQMFSELVSGRLRDIHTKHHRKVSD